MSRLIDYFPSWMTGGGIFAGLTGVPWDDDASVDKIALDIQYYGNHAGYKEASPLIDKFCCFNDDHIIDDVEMERLRQIIRQTYALSWQKQYDAITAAYNPIENYSMIEESTPGVVTTVKTETDTEIHNESTGSVYAFNSPSAVPASEADGTSKTTGDKNKNYTEESKTGSDRLTRSGNIGVTTSQQMIESEIELRKKQFFEIVYRDVDNILTCPIWAERCNCYV